MRLLSSCAMLALCAAGAAAAAAETAVTPVQKVVTMLTDMEKKAESEKNDEEVRFTAFQNFCKNTGAQKQKQIEKSKSTVEALNAEIQKADADMLELSEQITGNDADIDAWDKDKKEATAIREKDHAEYKKTHAEYVDSIESTDQAAHQLKHPVAFTQTAHISLMELSSKTRVSAHAKAAIHAFLRQSSRQSPTSAFMQDAAEADSDDNDDDAEQAAAPEATGFKSSSDGSINMVVELGSKFQEEVSALEKEETEQTHAHQMMLQELTDNIEGATRERESKSAKKSGREQDKALAQGNLADTTNNLNEDEKFLADLVAECNGKADDFKKNQEVRSGELEAIAKAIEIISSDTVSGSADRNLPQFMEESSSPTLAQLRVSRAGEGHKQIAVAAFLQDRAHRADSQILSLISVRAKTAPFNKVARMIKGMISKLMEESAEEAEHKGFCDSELGQNKITRTSKTDEAASLKAEAEELNATIAQLTTQIGELTAQIASIDAAMTEATVNRQAEKENNAQVIADAKGARAATGQALKVLKNFYATAGPSAAALPQMSSDTDTSELDTSNAADDNDSGIHWDQKAVERLDEDAVSPSFVQKSLSHRAETFASEPYGGSSASAGVLGMLEVIESDFARLLSETMTEEENSSNTFKKFSDDSGVDKATKGATLKHKSAMKQQKESALVTNQADLRSTQEELSASMDYFAKLKPSCIDQGLSYSERVARRNEEIQSLKEAMGILSD